MSALSNARRFNSSNSNSTAAPSSSAITAAVGQAAAGAGAAAEQALMAGVLVSIGWHQTSIVGVTALLLDAVVLRCSSSSRSISSRTR